MHWLTVILVLLCIKLGGWVKRDLIKEVWMLIQVKKDRKIDNRVSQAWRGVQQKKFGGEVRQ
jgi:hypothetical protein